MIELPNGEHSFRSRRESLPRGNAPFAFCTYCWQSTFSPTPHPFPAVTLMRLCLLYSTGFAFVVANCPVRAQTAMPPHVTSNFPLGRYGQVVTAAEAQFPLVAGQWEFRFGADGLAGVFNPKGERMVLGSYVVRGDTLILTDVDGPMSCANVPNAATAVLLWSLKGDQLLLTTLVDPCVPRRASGFRALTRLTDEESAKAPPSDASIRNSLKNQRKVGSPH